MLTRIETDTIIDLTVRSAKSLLAATRYGQTNEEYQAKLEIATVAQRELMDYLLSITDMNTPTPPPR